MVADDGRFAVVAIGSSWGGVQALPELIGGLPADFPLPILIGHHVSRDRPTMLPTIIARRSRLPVALAEEDVKPKPGSVYIAPPDRHLLVRPDGRIGLSDDERVNWCRPAADVLFRSAATVHGAGTIGVVLSGLGRDGAMGCRSIRDRDGFVIAQDEKTAQMADMPLAARDVGGADLVLPLAQIAAALDVLARLGSCENSCPTVARFLSRPDQAHEIGALPVQEELPMS